MIDYQSFKVQEVQGRYVTYPHINGFLTSLSSNFKIDDLGKSVQKNKIKSITFGTGPIRILMWSQMHGNESTTTKAVLDLLNYLNSKNQESLAISETCTLKIIPILNPDGALAYTRVNANKIDLNRDAKDLSQPESRILSGLCEGFAPHYCLNLHDQRTIFNVGESSKPATVSFLAPAFDEDRNNSPSRKISMQLIAAINSELQKVIGGQVGRYDDGFNPNCVGDAFQMKEIPTILFEAGHFPEDYQREKTRELIFLALLKCINTIKDHDISNYTIDQYLEIPENSKRYVDVLVLNPNIVSPYYNKSSLVSILYKEELKDGKILFRPEVLLHEDKNTEVYGHRTVDCSKNEDIDWMKEKGIFKLLT